MVDADLAAQVDYVPPNILEAGWVDYSPCLLLSMAKMPAYSKLPAIAHRRIGEECCHRWGAILPMALQMRQAVGLFRPAVPDVRKSHEGDDINTPGMDESITKMKGFGQQVYAAAVANQRRRLTLRPRHQLRGNARWSQHPPELLPHPLHPPHPLLPRVPRSATSCQANTLARVPNPVEEH
ncbi:hypothetical protein PG994_009116 [Apiospora phragmitis]|uniref:Uncharacterized protein n=1 Tax=Apiospora phragmitis TaxID=2905665 RepID=A0ABR1UL81_9PEZI